MTGGRAARWWERTGRLPEGRQGRLALVEGTDLAISCPKCGNAPVVYNGNYFCDDWDYPAGPDDCDWALPHPATARCDREVCDLIGIDYN